ncbi:hypothetical protein LguiA_031948 [Lonicera macranthoides]
MDHRYGLPDLTQLMAGKTHLPAIPQGSDHQYTHWNPPVPPPLYEFGDMNNSSCGLEREGFNNEMSRWGRQETLTLLEVRSLLHHTFKDAAVPKAPLWDQVSRIMREEHGYHRSGKKCKEKFENLYKYYKKTKECKNGRQDGKTYRFFRQLEALCGESSNNPSISETLNQETNLFSPDSKIQQNFHIKKIPESLSLSNSDAEFDTSSSEKNGAFDIAATGYSLKKEKKRVNKNRLKKIENLIESRMEVLMERQEAWMEKMMNIIEFKGHIRVNEEKEWRKQEATRFDQEYEILANERAFNEARDTELMESLQIFAKNEVRAKEIEAGTHKMFEQSEISSLMQIRTSMEAKFQEFGCFSESLWEEVASKMGVLGYDFCARKCKETWDTMSVYYNGQDFVKEAS